MNTIKNLDSHPIFQNLNPAEISTLMKCFSFTKHTYKTGEYILLEGDKIYSLGLILEGVIMMEKDDFSGNCCFVTELMEGEVLADPFIGQTFQTSTVSYKALSTVTLLTFPYKNLWKPCAKNCHCHTILIENVTLQLAAKTRTMLAKIELLSKKSLRDRILTFLLMLKNGQEIAGMHPVSFPPGLSDNQIFVPLTRTQLAQYLCVNRSSMVRELKRLTDEGILTIHKNIFTFLET